MKEIEEYIEKIPLSGFESADISNVAVESYESSDTVLDEDEQVAPIPVTVKNQTYEYMPWGSDNRLPYHVMHLIRRSIVMSQNKLFNILCCYGQGLQYFDESTEKPSANERVKWFCQHNKLTRLFLEQCTDMKHFAFSVVVLLLNKRGNEIVGIRHKEACYCRFTKAKEGKVEYLLYANWRNSTSPDAVEVVPMLDDIDPLGDLQRRMANPRSCRDRKFAVMMRFPTVGFQYYPIPYYGSVFRDKWYDISQLIGIGKESMLRNTSSISYHVEIHREYWRQLFRDEHITDAIKQKERVAREKQKIRDFLLGIQNQGKVWISGYYTTEGGKETHMVKITLIGGNDPGGKYSSDIEEANNILAYADNTHPNLIGATPGKSQMNNSGSDKRELFTLKQSTEKAFHDILLEVHNLVIWFNGWSGVYPEVPIILLTTLDENKDAKKVNSQKQEGKE